MRSVTRKRAGFGQQHDNFQSSFNWHGTLDNHKSMMPLMSTKKSPKE